MLAHYRQVFQARSSCWVLAAECFPKASRFVLLAKPTILIVGWSCFRALYSEAIYRIKSTGDSGEPCGTPATTRISPVCWPSKCRIATRLLSQALTHTTTHRGKPCSRRVARSRVWLTVSKAPKISNYRRLAVARCRQASCTWATTSRIASSVDRCSLLPICSAGSRPWASAALVTLLATIASISFPTMGSRAIGL